MFVFNIYIQDRMWSHTWKIQKKMSRMWTCDLQNSGRKHKTHLSVHTNNPWVKGFMTGIFIIDEQLLDVGELTWNTKKLKEIYQI